LVIASTKGLQKKYLDLSHLALISRYQPNYVPRISFSTFAD
jgi:hypothetical protein